MDNVLQREARNYFVTGWLLYIGAPVSPQIWIPCRGLSSFVGLNHYFALDRLHPYFISFAFYGTFQGHMASRSRYDFCGIG